MTTGDGTAWPNVAAHVGNAARQAVVPGSVLADRYEILQMLGEGGMGAVFKARDRELDRLVALKVIRPELADRPSVLARFKQELLFAREVSHRNVIRLFDLGVAGDLRFITMEFVEGRDLFSLLEKQRKFSPEEAVQIIRQVCEGLEAAHACQVIHRDLKPQNIMIGNSGRISVMDFGLARSLETAGLTQTGAILGTPAYMSPEQAAGSSIDARSDIFSLGIIFYELLTGEIPFQAGTVAAVLLKRTGKPPIPPAEIDNAVPAAISGIVMKCLAVDPVARFQSAREIIQQLDVWRGVAPEPAPSIVTPRMRMMSESGTWKWIVVSMAAMVAILGIVFTMGKLQVRPAAPAPVSVLVADFTNATSDPVFDYALEPILSVALEGASFINSFERIEAHKLALQLQPGAVTMEEPLARLVAARRAIHVVVAGSIAGKGGRYRLSVRAIDALKGSTIKSEQLDGLSKEGVLGAVVKLAAHIRQALHEDSPITPPSDTFGAASIEAAHAYGIAEQKQWLGKTGDAIAAYEKAIELDPNLARAYAGIAVRYASQGNLAEAEKYQQMAMARMDRMSARDKYKMRGTYDLNARHDQRALDELRALAKAYPSDSAGQQSLSLAYFYRRDFLKALEAGRYAAELDPQNAWRRNNVSLFAMYAGDFDTAEREARAALGIDPSYVKAHLAIAIADLAMGKVMNAAETYRHMAGLSPLGASLAAMGLADIALFEGRPGDAIAILEKAIAADGADKTAAALQTLVLAEAHLMRGHKPQAAAAADAAMAAAGQDYRVGVCAARIYLQTGQESKARAIAANIGKGPAPEPQAYTKIIEGELWLQKGNPREAIQTLRDAQRVSDTWLGRLDLGRAFIEAKAYAEADSELDLCLKRKGEATALFLDDIPSYRYLPAVYYYLGRAREGLNSPGAGDSYRTFLAIREKATPDDPLVADAKLRVGAR